MIAQNEFRDVVAQAYEHLYDLVVLRCHPLADLLIDEVGLERKERAWKLHHLLLEALDDLDPGPSAPATSVELRRHQLMTLRYVDGLDPQATADRLAISRRHFYREHDVALDAVAQILWQRYRDTASQSHTIEAPPVDRGELLRLEAERLGQGDRFVDLHEVLPGILTLLGGRLCQRNLTLEIVAPTTTPPIGLDRSLLRQLLLAAFSFLVERCADTSLTLTVTADPPHIRVQLTITHALPAGSEPRPGSAAGTDAAPADPPTEPGLDWEPELASVRELASLGQAAVNLLTRAGALAGLALRLPTAALPTVLVVDDNPDTLEFFHRILPFHGYRVVSVSASHEVLHLAGSVRPEVILLDVMIPGQDGWELLQILRNQPETQEIPVVICSVLRASELALSLGANAFLAKPLTEEALLASLQHYRRDP